MSKLRIGGTWAGVLEVELETWNVAMLREEVAKRSELKPHSINLICAGRILKDDDDHGHNLAQSGVKNNAKILATRICAEEGASIKKEMMAEEERSKRLARVKAAATSLAQRHAEHGSLPVEDFNIEVEDQSGNKVHLGSETDRRAILMGLMLDANGKRLVQKGNYKDAIEVLTMGEEAFSLCDPKVLELIDNVPILQINMVWCYFMLRDITWLSEAGKRLEMARAGLEHSHGKDSLRLRLLQGGRYPELALHLRLELLEGVVAYYSGQLDKARASFTSAKIKFVQLQVSDEALSLVMSMGFKECDAKRALRMNNQDVGGAIDFLVEEKAKKEKKRREDLQRRDEICEQKQYGMTPLKKAVDLQRLKELTSIGFEKELAAEALRRNENDTQKALDDLTNPDTNSVLQVHIESRKRKPHATESAPERQVQMGYERSRVVAAFEAGGTAEQVDQTLMAQTQANPNNQNEAAATNNIANSIAPLPVNNFGSSGIQGQANGGGSGSSEGPSPQSNKAEVRDVEMEDEISSEIARTDALDDYDIEVNIEGEAIAEYLTLLESSAAEAGTSSGKVSTSSPRN